MRINKYISRVVVEAENLLEGERIFSFHMSMTEAFRTDKYILPPICGYCLRSTGRVQGPSNARLEFEILNEPIYFSNN